MASVVHTPLVINGAIVKLANTRTGTPVFTEFSDASLEVKLTNTFETYEHKPVSGVNQNRPGPLSQTVTISVASDLKTGSLWLWLMNNHGVAGKIEFYPAGGTLPKVAADVVIVAPSEVGGAQGLAGPASVTLTVDGLATITAAA